ncbi:BatA domain-containing protein [Hyphobacterium sp. CCMP332]|nr:BatA domain-containing protein [Hyphobacterium sp. CCMP332]
MNFLYPQFLWALAAISIPIIIHLFNFQRPKKIFFSNVSLLESVKTQTASVQNIKHYLVLLSRILFLLFLVLAFAQPFLPASKESANTEKRVKVFYLDNSYSMQEEKDANTLLEEGVAGLEALSDIIGNNEDVYFLDNNFNVKDMFPYTKAKFYDRLAEINESYIPRTFDEVLRRIDQIEHKGPKEIFFISDLQKSTLGDPENIILDSNNIYHLIPVQNNNNANVSIDSAWLDNPFIFGRQENNIHVRLNYDGDESIENFPVKLFINEKQAAASNTNLTANGNSELQFSIRNTEEDESLGRIKINDSPVFFDNEYYFVLKSLSNISVLVVSKEENQYFKALYQTEEFFNYSFMAITNPDFNLLRSADFIVVDALDEYPDFFISILNEHIKENGHVLFISGKENNNLKNVLEEFGIRNISVLENDKPQTIADPDLNNPFFEGVFERFEKNTDMPDAIPKLDIRNMDLVHLKFKDGKAFLGEKSYGKGKVFVITGDIQKGRSNFFRHSIFVPVMYKVSTSFIGKSSTRLAYNFGEKSILWKMQRTNQGESAIKLRNESFEIIPEQRPVPEGTKFDLPAEKLEQGFYQLVIDDSVLGTIAINTDKEESDLNSYEAPELKEKIKGGDAINLNDDGEIREFAGEYKESHFGTPLWKYFLICSLLFLVAEVLLLRYL